MISELSDKIWENPRFHEAARRAEMAWLKQELGVETDLAIATNDANKLIRAAAILACSEHQAHREAAFRAATACMIWLQRKRSHLIKRCESFWLGWETFLRLRHGPMLIPPGRSCR